MKRREKTRKNSFDLFVREIWLRTYIPLLQIPIETEKVLYTHALVSLLFKPIDQECIQVFKKKG